MSLFGYTLSSFGTSAKGAFRRGIARRLRDGNVDVNEKAVEFMGISSGSERRRLAATGVNVDYQIVLRNTSEASSASNLLGASSAALLQKALKDAGMGELSGVSVLVAPFTQAPPPPPSPPSPPFPPPSARGGGSGGMSNEMVIIISVVVCAVGIGGATAACLIVNRLKGAEKELQSASSRGSHWADEDYVGEASPHRITSPRGEADDSKNVEMGNMGHAAYSMANANDGRMRLPPLGAQPDGRPRLPPLAASEKGGDVPSASVDDVLRDAEPSDPGAGPSFRRHDLSVDTSSTSGAAGGASAADPSPAHIAPATKGWGTPKNQAGLGQQEGGGRASRGRRGLSFGGIISGSSGS